jgi:hypothetical protein
MLERELVLELGRCTAEDCAAGGTSTTVSDRIRRPAVVRFAFLSLSGTVEIGPASRQPCGLATPVLDPGPTPQ